MDIKTYLSGFDKAEKINKGMAGDEKYHCQRGWSACSKMLMVRILTG